MVAIKRLVLDILKPHHPNALEFGALLAAQGRHRVKVTVVEIDEMTDSLQVEIEGPDIDFARLQTAIAESGASLHSIDEVEVEGEAAPPA
jgi:hypothetical protein